jgi:RNA:NAD 2'-phosphotransferase (TPT1/KptA family)
MDTQTQQLLLNRLAQVQPQLALDSVIAYHGTRASALQSIRDNGILSHPFKHYHPSPSIKGRAGLAYTSLRIRTLQRNGH